MGNVEERVHKRVKRVRIQNALLATVYGMGAVTLAMAAPNTLRLLKVINPHLDKRFNPSRRLQQATSRLVARDFLQWCIVGGKKSLQVTPKGKSFAEGLIVENTVNSGFVD